MLDRLFSRPRAPRRSPKFVRAAIGALLMTLMASSAFAQATRTVTATWDRNTDATTAGYVVLYGTASGNYQWNYDAGNQVTAQITLTTGSLYYFAVRAYDSAGQQSLSSDEATIDLRTQTPAPTATISASMQNATTALVTWSTTNAASATINGLAVPLSGSQSVNITQTTTFTIVATSASGATATQSATATVSAPAAPTGQITATMQNATTALVTWSTTNAVSATINGLSVPLSGSQAVPVSATTTFTLVATSASGATVTRSATATVSTQAPTASLTATLQGGNALLTWTTTNAVRAEINGVAVGLSGSVSVPVTGPTTFRLLATAASGAMVDSVASVTPAPSTGAPNAPTNTVAVVSGARVNITWRAPASGSAPQRYLVYVGSTPGASNLANAYPISGLSVWADLPRGQYYVRVRAANASGMSADSNEANVRVGKVLKVPSSFGVRWAGAVATLSWSVTAGDGTVEDQPTGYVLEAGTAPGLSDVAAVNIGNVTSFSAPIPSGAYYVRVRAVNDFGESDPTSEIRLAAPGAPNAPTGLVAFNSATLVELRWSAPDGAAPTTYVLEVGSAPGQSDLVTAAIGNVTRFTAPAPPAGTYYVRVRAVNGSGPSPVSNEVVVRR